MSVITYETFRKFQRKEKENKSLQELPDEFYESCQKWIERKQALYEKNRDPSLLREIENVMNIIKDIMDRRENKIVTLALHHVRGDAPPDNLLPRERKHFDRIAEELKALREETLKSIKDVSPEEKELDAVTIKEELDAFVGPDGEEYGPFEKGEETVLPPDVVDLLKKKGTAAG